MKNKYNISKIGYKNGIFILLLLLVIPFLAFAQTQAPSIRTNVQFDWLDE